MAPIVPVVVPHFGGVVNGKLMSSGRLLGQTSQSDFGAERVVAAFEVAGDADLDPVHEVPHLVGVRICTHLNRVNNAPLDGHIFTYSRTCKPLGSKTCIWPSLLLRKRDAVHPRPPGHLQ